MEQNMKLKIKYFLLGVGSCVIIVLLTAAANTNPSPHYGRYQISSWAGQIGDDSGSIGAFVLDTATGETKTVYSRTYGKAEQSRVERNNLKTVFASMQ